MDKTLDSVLTEITKTLEEARHELATLNGLSAFDGACPEKTWVINTTSAIKRIDNLLN